MKNNNAVVDRTMIESLAGEVGGDLSNDIIYQLVDMIDDITIDLASHNKFVNLNSVDLKLTGDFALHTNIIHSDLDFYLAIRSGQLELNTLKELQNKPKRFLTRLKKAWLTVRARKKRRFFTRKKKKNDQLLTEEQLTKKKQKPYVLRDLQEEYFNYILPNFTELSVIYNKTDRITILSKEELGYSVNIIPVFVHDDELRYWDHNKNQIKVILLNDAIRLMEEKNEEINKLNYSQNTINSKTAKLNNNDIFYKVVRIFKSLTVNAWQTTNLSFIDSLLYNCPNELFVGNVYEAFIRSFNYLKNANIADFYSVYNLSKNMYVQHNTMPMEIKSLLKEISLMITNDNA